jgi:hypothetical protein
MAAIDLTSTISTTAPEICLFRRIEGAADSTKNGTIYGECCQSNGGHKETCESLRDVERDGR